MKKGFTLIEILVTIAIISVLSGIVMANLSNSRNKANDQKIKSQMANFRVAAQNYFETYGDYGTPVAGGSEAPGPSVGYSCNEGIFNQTGISETLKASNYPSYVSNATTKGWCSSTASGYAISLPLKKTGTFWCIDSRGTSILLTGARHDPGNGINNLGDDCNVTE